jgi:hypothetical protein
MSAQNRQYINLDECIYAYIDEAELSNHKYFKLYNIAFRALTELGMDAFYQIKSVKLPVNANNTVYLPADYLNYSKVGIINSAGEVATLTYNNLLTTYADLLPNRLANVQGEYLGQLGGLGNINGNAYYNYWDNGSYYNLFGVPSGAPFIGSFKIDNDNGVIILNVHYQWDYIILEYLASPKEGEQFMVPIQFKEAIISYLRWKDIISLPNTRRGTLGDKGQRRAEWFNDRRLAIARWKTTTISEAYDANLKMQRLTVKV